LGDAAAGEVDLLYAPRQAKGRFFNPWNPETRGMADLLRWKLGRNPYGRRRPPEVPIVANDGAYLASPSQPPSLTWVGHSTFALQDGPDVVLTDPHWGPRAFLPPRLTPPGIPLASVPPHAFAVLSHNHYDHLDAWTVAHLPPIPWFVPLGLGPWLRRRLGGPTVPTPPIVELDWWQSVRHGRWTLTALPAQHWSNRLDMGRNSTLWCSWLLDSGSRRIFFAGDSGYFGGFAEIGRRFGPIDVALLPIGAYEPRWFMRLQHMSPAEALGAFQDLGAAHMVAMHWGVFDLTDEPVDLAPRVLAREVAAGTADLRRVHALGIGERWLIP
jgi:N-acyl-phosphatidylethanolamine-hydrolysing phospholipase D